VAERLPDFLKMRPYLREMVWGGRRLESEFGKALPPGKAIGESWEVSAYEGMESVVEGGPFDGWDLRRLTEVHGEGLLGGAAAERYDGAFPLLIKMLDANQDLSIQVHPDDAYAQANDLGRFGKMEAWYVLKSDGGRIAYGLREGNDADSFQKAIEEGSVESAVRYLDASPGDVVPLMPGTVHALCAGVMVYEVQQTSDLTFRIYDYGRPGPDGKPRDLHIEQAMDVIDFGEEQPRVVRATDDSVLFETEHFRLERIRPDGRSIERPPVGSFTALTVVSGEMTVTSDNASEVMATGDTVLVPAGRGFTVAGEGDALGASVPT
jgi:mannose-6-phosphate isomerase